MSDDRRKPAPGGAAYVKVADERYVGSDWAPGYYMGQCADNEYVAGVACTWRWLHYGVPDALLCRPLS
ncbi:hypothetical protein AB0K51_14165 [Kitasatospora sp. NPDC049285]|uniref:hypothetical protein n=1 Tax=Kitasatospora sp. NPDC049285 TaxID=3157096 RepID=UPI00341CF9E9